MQAMRAGLQGTMRVKGLLEMMFEVLSDWIDAFIEDIEEVEASETGSTTPKGSLSPRDGRGKPIHVSSRRQTWLPTNVLLVSFSLAIEKLEASETCSTAPTEMAEVKPVDIDNGDDAGIAACECCIGMFVWPLRQPAPQKPG